MDNMNQLSHEDISDRIANVLEQETGLKLVLMYGSAAADRMRHDSDVDIAVLFDNPLNLEQKMDLISRLERELKRNVDLVDLFNLSGTILKQILCKGRILINNDPAALTRLYQRMVYNQADMMPYVTRTLLERQQRFLHG
jgi:predicted nucleotidyltransferase